MIFYFLFYEYIQEYFYLIKLVLINLSLINSVLQTAITVIHFVHI